MNETTIEVIRTIINGDPSVDAADKARLMKLVGDGGADAATDPLLRDRLVRRAEVARLLGRSASSVDRLVRSGILEKVVFKGRQRSAGFRLSDVTELVSGGRVG